MTNVECPYCGYELDSWNDCVSFNNILECPECEEHFELEAIRLNKSQLTIPKSIADELDKIPNEAKRYVQENGFDDYSILDDFVELREFYEADEDEAFPGFTGLKEFVKDNLNLCALYLADKALGVDLVKVGKG